MAEQEHTAIFPQLSESSWLLEIDGFDTALEPTIEAVCALVNGYGGTRAAIEEGSPVSHPATFIAGIFNTPAQPQTPEGSVWASWHTPLRALSSVVRASPASRRPINSLSCTAVKTSC